MELVLHLTDEPARVFRTASRKLSRPVLAAHRRLRGDAERLQAKGVVFVREPARMDYGSMDAVDDTCGNLINLHRTEHPFAIVVLVDPCAEGDGCPAEAKRWDRSR